MAKKAAAAGPTAAAAESYQDLFSQLSVALHDAGAIAAALARVMPASTTTMTTAAPVAAAAGGTPAPKSRKASAGRKAERDPDAPKRPMSAFLIYCRDRRKAFIEENPTITGRAIQTAIGKEWNSLSPEQRAPYEVTSHTFMDDWRLAKEVYDGPNAAHAPAKPKKAAAAPAPTKPAAPALASKPAVPAAVPATQPYVAPGIQVVRTAGSEDEDEKRRRKKEEKRLRKQQERAQGQAGDGDADKAEGSHKKKKKHHDSA